MILKHYELNKKEINNLVLFYGKNEGFKKDKINEVLSKNNNSATISFNEEEVLKKNEILFDEVLNKSLFESQKNIIINNASDKSLNIILELLKIELKDVIIILNTGPLEKRSKIRNLFEKEEKLTCIPFYEDKRDDLIKILNQFLSEKKISLSQSNINFLINRCNGDRKNLLNELQKIALFANNKPISSSAILKLTNLYENYSISELTEAFLIKNIKKVINIFNENNFYSEDSIIIIKTLQKKVKRLLNLSRELNRNKNIEFIIAKAKPPIFWKEKDIIREQLNKQSLDDINQLLFSLNDLEKLVKKNINMSINIISNFMIHECSSNN